MKIRCAALPLLALPVLLMGCGSGTNSTTLNPATLSKDAQAVVAFRQHLDAAEGAYQQASKDLAQSMQQIQAEGPATADEVRQANLNHMRSALEAIRDALNESAQITPPTLDNPDAQKALATALRAHRIWALASRQKIDRFFQNNYPASEAANRKSESASQAEVAALSNVYQILKIPTRS